MRRASCRAPDSVAEIAASGWTAQSSLEFVFAGYDWFPERGTLKLNYRLDGMSFSEQFRFPLPDRPVSAPPQAVRAAIELLHWLAGVSYWKAGCPRWVRFDGSGPDRWQAAWLNRVYRDGLAEFAWHHELGPERFEVFSGPERAPEPAAPAGLGEAVLLPLGGGKDSLVAWSRLHQLGRPPVTVQVGSAGLITDVARSLQSHHLVVERQLDPGLQALNARGALNGHVPVTAINAAALTVLALLHGCGAVVFANERSAEEATLTDATGRGVNHQFSKTLAFESMFDHWVRSRIAPDLAVFSILRQDRELAICREFARLEPLHAVFSSCNRNFHLGGSRTDRWCGACPKCHFVFLCLAPFMAPQALVRIFGADLLDDPACVDGFRALLALDGRKPFECVGEADEARSALRYLSGQPEWRKHAVVAALSPALDSVLVPEIHDLCRSGGPHLIPGEFQRAAG